MQRATGTALLLLCDLVSLVDPIGRSLLAVTVQPQLDRKRPIRTAAASG
jgi:hypothetical protein